MKRIKAYFIAFIAVTTMLACGSNDDSTDTPAAYGELIIGTWKLTSATTNGTSDTLSECQLLETLTITATQVTFLFQESDDGNAPCEEETNSSTYSLESTSLTVAGGQVVEITLLNTTTFSVKYTEEEEDAIVIETYTRQ
jgi:hypothetical protein